jgi:hypothetical protein
MNVTNLLISLRIETSQFLTRRMLKRLLKVRTQTPPTRGGLVANLVLCIEALSALGSIELLIEVSKGGGEPARKAVLLVQGDRLGNGVVADYVAVREVFGDDARAGLVFLGNVVLFFFSFALGVGGAG